MPPQPFAEHPAGPNGKGSEKNIRASSIYEPTIYGGQSELEAVESRKDRGRSQARLQTISEPPSSSIRRAEEYRVAIGPPPQVVPPPVHGFQPWVAELPASSPPAYKRDEKLCGLTPRFFWIAVLFIVFLLAVGIATGLGVGLRLLDKSHHAASTSAVCTPTVTIYIGNGSQGATTYPAGQNSATATSTAPTGAVYTNPGTANSTHINYESPKVTCPEQNNLNVTFPYYLNGTAFMYTIQCDTNYGTGNGGIRDIQIVGGASTLTECIDLCSTYNIQLPQGPAPGEAVGYSGFCSGIFFGGGACYLKSGVSPDIIGHSGQGDGAMLLKSPVWNV